MRLKTPYGQILVYNILQIFPFTSETKRMGIIVRVGITVLHVDDGFAIFWFEPCCLFCCLLRSRYLGCHATLPPKNEECCVTSQITVAKETICFVSLLKIFNMGERWFGRTDGERELDVRHARFARAERELRAQISSSKDGWEFFVKIRRFGILCVSADAATLNSFLPLRKSRLHFLD